MLTFAELKETETEPDTVVRKSKLLFSIIMITFNSVSLREKFCCCSRMEAKWNALLDFSDAMAFLLITKSKKTQTCFIWSFHLHLWCSQQYLSVLFLKPHVTHNKTEKVFLTCCHENQTIYANSELKTDGDLLSCEGTLHAIMLELLLVLNTVTSRSAEVLHELNVALRVTWCLTLNVV